MMTPLKIPIPLPPSLSMDEYFEFVEDTLRNCDPVLAARQKSLEEHIARPFRMTQTNLLPPPAARDSG